MAGVTVKMGVTGVSEFKRNIGDAEAAIKALNESLKLNESQLKLNGNQEQYLTNKVQILKDRITKQTEVVQAAEAALQSMKDKGVNPASKEFQNMQAKVYQAATKLTDMKTELKEVETNAGGAAEGLGSVEESVKNIDKNVSWKNVADGIGKVADTLERGAKAAYNFGRKIVGSLKGSSGWADDLQTMSDAYDIPTDKLQRIEKVAYIIETDAESILRAQQKMSKAAAGEGADDIMELFGIDVAGKDPEELFWQLGDAILDMGEAFDKEAAAQKVFGRSWRELVPLFKMGREEYEKLLGKQTVLTDEQIKNLTEADDAIAKMEIEIQTLKNQFWSENADKITGLLQWLMDNKDGVVTALTVIGGGFGALKLAETAANVMSIVNGFKSLGLIKGAETAGKAAQAVAGAAGTAGKAATAAAGTGGKAALPTWMTKLGLSGMAGIGGAASIVAGFGWAGYRRNFEREKVRGTDEHLEAQSEGLEQLLADYIRAQQAITELDWSTTAEVFDAAQEKVTDAYNKLMEAEGGADALQAYSDWRQERSLGNMDWEMPENIDKMTRTIEESFTNQTQSNSEMTAAAGELKGLPAAVGAAVRSGMSGVTIVINESAVGAIGRRISGGMANSMAALVK